MCACVSNRRPKHTTIDVCVNVAFERDSNNEPKVCDLDQQQNQQQHEHKSSYCEETVYSITDNKTTVDDCNNNEALKHAEFNTYL